MSELWVEPAWAVKRDLPAATPKQEKDRGSVQGMMRRMFPDVKRWNLCIPVSVYDLKGFYVATFASVQECALALGCCHNVVLKVVNGGGKSAGGFQIRRANIIERNGDWFVKTKRIASLVRERVKTSVAVSVYDLNGFYVTTYPSARSASRACGLSKSGGSVSSMVSNNGKSKDGCRQLRGFQFRRARRMPGSDEWDKSPIAKYRGHYYWRYWNQTHK